MAQIRDICGLNYDIMLMVGKAVEAKRKADTIDYWISRNARKLAYTANRAWLSSDAPDGSPLDEKLSDAADNAHHKFCLNKQLPMDFMEFVDIRQYKNLTIKATKRYFKAKAKRAERAKAKINRENERKYGIQR